MSASFIAVAFLAAVLIVNWRLVLLVLAACLVALIAFGIGVVRPEPLPNPAPSGTTQVEPVYPVYPEGSSTGDVGQPSH